MTPQVYQTDEQEADLKEARAEFEFRSRQLFDLTSYARVADMPPNRLAERDVYAKYVEARDNWLKLVGAL